MNCRIYKTASDFLHSNEESLLMAESEHNVILGVADGLRRGTVSPENTLMISVMQNSRPVGQAIKTDPDKPLAISKMERTAATALVEFLLEQRIPLGEVTGPIESARSFAEAWRERTGKSPHPFRHLGVYELHRVVFPSPDGRSLIPITAVSADIVMEYVLGFFADCFPEEKDFHRQSVVTADRHRKNETLFFWKGEDDLQPVSMAANSRNTRNGATISLVYTPPNLRGLGHASRMVAALSDQCLRSGKKFCNLFTDLSNPTSNSIYQKLGYRKIGESLHYTLQEKGV